MPILFNIFINELGTSSKNALIKYVDDKNGNTQKDWNIIQVEMYVLEV